jgi:hypothetical protein
MTNSAGRLRPSLVPSSRSARGALWCEPVAGVTSADEPTDQPASADSHRREHEPADLTPDLLARCRSVVRCLLRQAPDLGGHELVSFGRQTVLRVQILTVSVRPLLLVGRTAAIPLSERFWPATT